VLQTIGSDHHNLVGHDSPSSSSACSLACEPWSDRIEPGLSGILIVSLSCASCRPPIPPVSSTLLACRCPERRSARQAGPCAGELSDAPIVDRQARHADKFAVVGSRQAEPLALSLDGPSRETNASSSPCSGCGWPSCAVHFLSSLISFSCWLKSRFSWAMSRRYWAAAFCVLPTCSLISFLPACRFFLQNTCDVWHDICSDVNGGGWGSWVFYI